MSPEVLDDTKGSEALEDDVKELGESPESKEEALPEDEGTKPESEETEEEESKEEEEEKPPEELSEEDQEQEAQITRPSWKELKDKFPGIEKNKEVREVYFREKAYSEIFPTVDDAKEANSKAEALDFFDSGLSTGDPNVLLKNLKPEVVDKLSQSLLPALYEHDHKLFVKATRPLLVNVINEVYERGVKNEDENLKTSVLNVCKILFGEFKLPDRSSGRKDPELENERRALNEERENLILGRRQEFTTKAEGSIHRQLTKIIQDGLNIDNEFLTESITDKTLAKVKATLATDAEFMARLNSIRRQAEKSGFAPEYITRIVAAYLGRAKGLALKLRGELKSSAMSKRSAQSVEKGSRRIEGTEKGNGESKSSSKADLRDTRKYSDLDIISGKA